MAEQLNVALTPIQQDNLETLKQQWLKLEHNANNSIFTHWYFIATWLAFINYKGKLLTVSFKGDIIGLAILTENTLFKNGVKVKQLWLNRTGDPKLDQIWNEYNDILCEKGLEYSIRGAVINFFETELTTFDELIIGVSIENIKETPRSHKIMPHVSWQAVSYQTDLKLEYKNWQCFIKSLSANTRYQIKRSAKLFGGIDNLKINAAKNAEEAVNFLVEAGKLHKIRWKNQNSGFENDKFVEFHQQFIKQNFHLNVIDVLEISTPEQAICYLYNFRYENKVYFYLSGIKYSKDNKLKPGLLAHSLAISYYADQGFKYYDFMGGEGRYKESLSNTKGSLIVVNFRRKTVPFLISRILNKIRSSCA